MANPSSTPSTPLYDIIGKGYDTTRTPDPRIADCLETYLEARPNDRILDLACGTANYTGLLDGRGFDIVGVDLSARMLAAARAKHPALPLVRADVSALPMGPGCFDKAQCTLAIHHFPSLKPAFAEVARVIGGGPFVIFTSLPEQTGRYWLEHYFPQAMARAVKKMPSRAAIDEALISAGFNTIAQHNWDVPPGLTDRFLYADKDNPGAYFDPQVRAGTSLFADLADNEEVAAGLAQLRHDIDSGAWQNVRKAYTHTHGDYCFIVANR